MNNDKFRKELEALINRHSMENGSNTPDFVLADYLCACLTAFDNAVKVKAAWENGTLTKNEGEEQ